MLGDRSLALATSRRGATVSYTQCVADRSPAPATGSDPFCSICGSGAWARTLLVFASDNGGGNHFAMGNAPLRGGKHTPLEGGVRVRRQSGLSECP